MNTRKTLTRGLILSLSLSAGLAACGPAPVIRPTPSPSVTPTPSPTPSASPSAMPTPTPTPEVPSTYFVANLNGSQEVPGVSSQGQGVARVVLAPGRSEASIEIVVSNLSGPITAAHVHRGAPGASGPAIKDLEVKGNVITGTWRRNDSTQRLDEDAVQDLLNGGLYVNVHTAANPNGEIRGQLNLSQDQVHVVYLSSGQEVPAVTATASGVALVRISPDGNQVSLVGDANGLTSEVTSAHIHRAAAGASGPVVKPISVDDSNHFTLTWRKNDADSPLTDELMAALKNGELYVNLHTVNNPNGELRGQIGKTPALSTNFWFSGDIDPAQEVPPVDRPGFGFVEAKLNAEAQEVELEAYVSGLSGPITGAHIHQGAAGFNGQVVKDLTIDGNRVSATWKASDTTQPLTKGLFADLLAGRLYVNVHTTAHPGGEGRAQLRSTAFKTYALGLSGSAEVPAVTGDGRAVASIGVSADQRTVTLKGVAHNLTGAITGAHIHQGPPGLSGPVVKELNVDGNSFTVVWRHTDQAAPLTPDLVAKLLAGDLYVNVHTAANPNGEVRAQIK